MRAEKHTKGKEIIEYSSEKINIKEILKDRPNVLEELIEIKKILLPMEKDIFKLNEESEKKLTKGQKKMKQLLEDARRNVNFAKELKRINDSKPAYSRKEIESLYILYRSFLNNLYLFRKKYIEKSPTHKLKKKLCNEYGIDPKLIEHLLSIYKEDQYLHKIKKFISNKYKIDSKSIDESLPENLKNDRLDSWDFSEETISDMCIVEPSNTNEEPVGVHDFHLNILDGIKRDVYPINLKIHRFASKNDILDFIEKKWRENIGPHLYEKRITQRQLQREVVDFIWKHKDKKAKAIVPLLEKKYPKKKLAYFQINKILSEERKRRKIK